jgi:diketogulonate reductase-like aldo/keto reductase
MIQLGFGTDTAWFKDDGKGPFKNELLDILKTALSLGFHHIDCADSCGTEEEVGTAIKESGVPREETFVTTKVLDGMNEIPNAIDTSLRKLQLDYVDMNVPSVGEY